MPTPSPTGVWGAENRASCSGHYFTVCHCDLMALVLHTHSGATTTRPGSSVLRAVGTPYPRGPLLGPTTICTR